MATNGRRGEGAAHSPARRKRPLPRRERPDLDQLARQLDDFRRWYRFEVAQRKVQSAATAAGLVIDGWLIEHTPRFERPGPRLKRPRPTAYEIAYSSLIAEGKRHPPVETLWLLHVADALDDHEIASILKPGDYQKRRDATLKAIGRRRALAKEWWAKRCDEYVRSYEKHGIPRDRWPSWLRGR